MKIKNYLAFIVFLSVFIPSGSVFSQSEADSVKEELARLNRELENPLTKRWSLVFQENLQVNNGDMVEGNRTANTFFFQPALPIPFGENMVFTARPVIPLVTSPAFSENADGKKSITGLGDIQVAAFLGDGDVQGWVWGVGGTFVFPTATDQNIGSGKYQAGPAVLLFHLSKKWTRGAFLQHWWSYAGDEARNKISRTDLQYIFRRNFGASSLGMGPSITINWEADRDNALTLPIGLGYTRTVRFGSTPVKMRIEPQYSIVKPKDYGTEWNIRIQIAPIIKSPFIN